MVVNRKCASKIRGKKVVIVGAGAAGLIAAKILGGTGFRTILIEASERLGGRIMTFRYICITCKLFSEKLLKNSLGDVILSLRIKRRFFSLTKTP